MGKFMSIVVGVVLALLAIQFIFAYTGGDFIIEESYFNWIVLGVGAILFFIPTDPGLFGTLKRWVSGAILIVIALATYLLEFLPSFEVLELITIGSPGSIVILLTMSLFFIASSFKKVRGEYNASV